MRDQLPLAEDKRNIFMNEFMGLKSKADANTIAAMNAVLDPLKDEQSMLGQPPITAHRKKLTMA